MHAKTPPAAARILFVPVSGPHGSGELMRCLTIARELRRVEPRADVHFLVSRDAVFREAVDFTVHDCDGSPTRNTPAVVALLRSLRPSVVVFDNAGRTPQLRAAREVGARLVFSSRSPRLRWKAFRFRWLRLLDEHWIVFPDFIAGGPTPVERIKLRLFPRYRVRRLATLFTPSQPDARLRWLAARNLAAGGYVVFVPGGRGEHPAVTEPAELFADAARRFVAATGGVAVVLTGKMQPPPSPDPMRLRLLPRIGLDEVQHLLAGAAMVVSNGGTSMVHALAHGRPVVAVPLADDQARRIRKGAALRILVEAPRDAEGLAGAAASLLSDAPRREQMIERCREMRIVNGVGEAVDALRSLAGLSGAPAPDATEIDEAPAHLTPAQARAYVDARMQGLCHAGALEVAEGIRAPGDDAPAASLRRRH